jgi:transposase
MPRTEDGQEVGMPERAFTRSQSYLLPPSYDELVAADHPIRYVAAFVDALPDSVWQALNIGAAHELGAPRYAPRLLLSLWLGGFLSGIRTSRGLERACQESLLFRWLSGGQTPDHNTLWRFLDTYRETLEVLLEQTVLTAAQAGLVEWACQAVDGTKILAHTRTEGTLSVAQLQGLRERTQAAIAELESQQVGEDMPPPPTLPAELQQAEALRARVEAVLAEVQELPADTRVSPNDAEARWMKTRQGSAPAYNAQAVVAALDPVQAGRPGRLILAAGRDDRGGARHGPAAAGHGRRWRLLQWRQSAAVHRGRLPGSGAQQPSA